MLGSTSQFLCGSEKCPSSHTPCSVTWGWLSLFLLGWALPPKVSPDSQDRSYTIRNGYFSFNFTSPAVLWFQVGSLEGYYLPFPRRSPQTSISLLTKNHWTSLSILCHNKQETCFLISVWGVLCSPHRCSALKSKYHCLGVYLLCSFHFW